MSIFDEIFKPLPKKQQWKMPDDKQTQELMKEYSIKLMATHPNWSKERATRKVAEKFKLRALKRLL